MAAIRDVIESLLGRVRNAHIDHVGVVVQYQLDLPVAAKHPGSLRPHPLLGRVVITFAWLHNLRRLRTRYERSPLHVAFMLLGCAVVCQRMLREG